LVDHGRNFLRQTAEVARLAVVLALFSACAPARSTAVGRTGMVMALVGVATIITSTVVSDHESELMVGGSALSAGGILLAAAHQMSTPEIVYVEEPEPIKLSRWARILTEHAAGAARSGNCAGVRKFEPRVRVYDLRYHDLVFMRDPEILRCLSIEPGDH
jgi:hypothetical protein